MSQQETIDMTQLEGETHVAEIGDKKVVAGSSSDDSGNEKTVDWPTQLPKELFNEDGKRGIKSLVLGHGQKAVADSVGNSETWVRQLKNKASIFINPASCEWLDDDMPTWSIENLPDVALEHPKARETLAVRDENSEQNTENRFTETTREIAGRYEQLGQNPDQIASEMGISMNKATGTKSIIDEVPDELHIVPESAADNSENSGVIDAEVLGQSPDLSECDCAVPSLAVDSTRLGPSQLQSLYCEGCDNEFTVIREKSGRKTNRGGD